MKKGYWVILCFVIVSCVSKDLPDNVLPQDKMASILLDVYMSEVKINHSKSDFSISDLHPLLMNKIYSKHQISDSVYRANMSYYLSHPTDFEKVYDIMIDSLNLIQQITPDDTDPSGNTQSKPE